MKKSITTLRNMLQLYAKTRNTAYKTIEIQDQSTHILIDMKGTEEALELHDKFADKEAFHIDRFMEWVKRHGCKVVAHAMNDKELSILHANTINRYAAGADCDLDEDAYIAWFLVTAPMEEVLAQFDEEQVQAVLSEIEEAKEIFL